MPIGYTIDYLESRHDVDATRVGLLGVSPGGYSAPRAAAYEPRVKATVCLAGAYNLATHFGRYPLLTQEAFIYRCKAANEAEVRVKLQRFSLEGVVSQMTCPLLVIISARDRIFPVEDSQRIVAEAGSNGERWLFADGNHVRNNIPYKHRPQQADGCVNGWLDKR